MNDDSQFYSMVHKMLDDKLASKEKLTASEIKDDVAARLKAYRVDNELSQEKLAEKLNVSRRQIERWEKKENVPGKLALEKMMRVGILKNISKYGEPKE